MRARTLAYLCSIPLLALLSTAGPARGEPFERGPPDADGPVEVSVGFFLSDVTRIDERIEAFAFESIVTLRWHDPRQAFDPEVVGAPERVYQGDYQFSEVYDGWWPQLILANESDGFETQAVLLRIAPDGSMNLVQEIDAVAEMPMQVRRFPFDRQGFEARFEVLGFGEDRVVLKPDPSTSGVDADGIDLAQWSFEGLQVTARSARPTYGSDREVDLSRIVATVQLARRPAHMLQVVVAPLTLLVLLTFSVFWMDHESLGERMDISFIGILTVVAYQIIVSEAMPGIAYFTLMSAFLYSTYLVLGASVIVNLVVSTLDRTGRSEMGDRLDRRCRWLLPLTFFGANALAAAYFLGVD